MAPKTQRKKRLDIATTHKTSADAYFHSHHRRALTSTNSYTQLVEKPESINPPQLPAATQTRLAEIQQDIEKDFPRWLLELQEGFSLILYGYGSKLGLLTNFASYCSDYGDVFRTHGQTTPTALLRQIATRLNVGEESKSSSESSISRIKTIVKIIRSREIPLFIIIDSIDLLNTTKEEDRFVFSSLSQLPEIRLITSAHKRDHLYSWIIAGNKGRKCDLGWGGEDTESIQLSSSHGCNWIWHDATTLQPYTKELEGRKLSVPPYADKSKTKGALSKGALVSQVAAEHILASVTDRARKLFNLVAKKQLQQMEEAKTDIDGKNKEDDSQRMAVSYTYAFVTARDGFLVSNDGQMKTLLSEFTDHGLIITGNSPTDGSEVLWIAMSADVLRTTLESSEQT